MYYINFRWLRASYILSLICHLTSEDIKNKEVSKWTNNSKLVLRRKCWLFIDYEKAFDRVERAFLWQKLLDSSVDGRILTVIKDMYRKVKSCENRKCLFRLFLLLFRRSPGGKFVTCTFCHLSKWPARVYGREIWRTT